MAMDVSAFGKKVSGSVADSVLSSPVLNANPAPASPATVPVDGLQLSYMRLYAGSIEALKLDKDPVRKSELERIVQFASTSMDALANERGSSGPPVPNGLEVPPPAPPAPPQAGPGPAPGGPGPTLPGAPAPGIPGMPT